MRLTLIRLFPIVVSLALLISAPSRCGGDETEISPIAKAYLEQVLDLMQEHALNRKSIGWKQVREDTLARAKGAQTTTDTYTAIAYAFTQLKERHSFLQFPDSLPYEKQKAIRAEMMKIRGPSPTTEKPSPFFPQKEMSGHIDSYHGRTFAHVFVPMCVGESSDWEKNKPYFQEFADKLHGIVMELQSHKPDGWIIDLRGNAGGNMWPMLAGIGVVLGEGDLGAFLNSDGNREIWFYKAGKSGTRTAQSPDDVSGSTTHEPFAFLDLPWVAVLFDRGTSSSGEAVAIAFAGRARERSFGEHTAGFSTSNDRHELSDGASLFLCEGLETDRTGKLYPEGLAPDVPVPAADVRPAEENDATVASAEQWLAAKTAPRH